MYEEIEYLMHCRYRDEAAKFESAKSLLMDEARQQQTPTSHFGSNYISLNFPTYATWRLRVSTVYRV